VKLPPLPLKDKGRKNCSDKEEKEHAFIICEKYKRIKEGIEYPSVFIIAFPKSGHQR
jgi:hypothetical protein